MSSKTERIAEIVNNLPAEKKINVWNKYCGEEEQYEDEILTNDESTITEFYSGVSLWDFAYMIEGTWHRNDEYFVERNGYLESFQVFDIGKYIYPTDVAEYCVWKNEDFGIREIRKILKEE